MALPGNWRCRRLWSKSGFGDMGSLWKGWGLKCFIHNRLPEASGQIVEEMGYGKIKWKVCV